MTHLGESKKQQLISLNLGIVIGVLISAVWLLLPIPFGRQFVALLLLFVWPGIAWADSRWLWRQERLGGDAFIISSVGGLAVMLTIVLGLSLLPGGIHIVILVLFFILFTLFPIALNLIKSAPTESYIPFATKYWLWTLLPIGIALVLRLPWFGYREIQGDEGIVLVRAADVLLGDHVELLLHRKGPMEILLIIGLWGLSGELNDFWARLPYLLCNLLSLVIFFQLAQRWFGRNVAILATCLWAIVGFHVAFSRVVQYQSLVMMWGIGAIFMAERYRHNGRGADLVLTAIMLAAGLLSHYDAILFAPAVFALLIGRWWQEKQWPVLQIGLAGACGLFMLGLFYIPFAFGPDFQNAIGYLLNDRVDTSAGGSLADVWQMVTFYNSSWFILGVGFTSLIGLFKLWQQNRPLSISLAAGLLALAPLFFYTVIVSVPRTHVYTFFPGLVLLAAIGLDYLIKQLEPNVWLIRLGWLGVAAWFLVSSSYIWLLFTWGPGEVQRNWQADPPNEVLYWRSWESPPSFGLFGFPYRAGWRDLGQLTAQSQNSVLEHGTGLVYASNEEAEITSWYMAQSPRTHCDQADIFVQAGNVQDEVVYDPRVAAEKESIEISQNMTLFVSESIELKSGPRKMVPNEISKPEFRGGDLVGVPLGEAVTLAGYDLILIDESRYEAVLYWHAHDYFDRNFQAFVHIVDDDGNLIAQHDSAPECGINPTTRWEPDTIIRDPHRIEMPADWPSDRPFFVLAGMYDLITQERLPVADQPGNFVDLAGQLTLSELKDRADANK